MVGGTVPTTAFHGPILAPWAVNGVLPPAPTD
jgi:hypothetical protein